MRVFHYLNHGRRANGHVEVAVDLACEQARQGHEVHFVSGPCDFTDVLAKNNVTFHLLPEKNGIARPFKMAGSLYRLCSAWRPDVINAHMVAAALAAMLIRPASTFKLVTTVHNSFDRQSIMMRVGDLVIAVSEAVRREMEDKWVHPRKLRVVRNGTIGGARRPMVPARATQLQHPAIVTVAGLHPRKGINDLIAAFDIVSESKCGANLYIVGEGPYRRCYEEQAQTLAKAQNIHFIGHCDDPREYLADADVFVLASLQEPFALVLSEARQMGCAIVATRVGGTPEALWHGKKGKLVPPSDPASLAAAVLCLIESDEERTALARAAQEDIEDIMVERMAKETLSVYEELLVGMPKPG